jgi:hypothetical protein
VRLGQAQFSEDALDLDLNGVDAHEQLGPDLLVREAAGQPQQHFALPLREPVGRPLLLPGLPRELVILREHPLRDPVREPEVAPDNRPDHLGERGARVTECQKFRAVG